MDTVAKNIFLANPPPSNSMHARGGHLGMLTCRVNSHRKDFDL